MRRIYFYKNKMIILKKFRYYTFGKLGDNIRTFDDVFWGNSQNIYIQDNVFISRFCYFDAARPIYIGSGTCIGPRCIIISGNHNYNSSDLKFLPYDERIIDNTIHIGENVWIGANVSISPNVSIGNGAVIAMGVSIYKDVEPLSIVGENMKIIGYRDSIKYNSLLKESKIYNVTKRYK